MITRISPRGWARQRRADRAQPRRTVAVERAHRALEHRRQQAPATVANVTRNARAERDRWTRWQPTRRALWELLDRHLAPGAAVAVVGAGNGDDVPLRELAARARQVDLIDVDAHAGAGARRRALLGTRRRIDVVAHDITGGAADRIARRAAGGDCADEQSIRFQAWPARRYDLVIGDLLYSQLLHPALVDLGFDARTMCSLARRHGPALTGAVVRRLHEAVAPDGLVVHLHDPLAWWPGHTQPHTLPEILHATRADPAAARRMIAAGSGPRASDPHPHISATGCPIVDEQLWPWPFATGVDYLVHASVAVSARPTGAADYAL